MPIGCRPRPNPDEPPLRMVLPPPVKYIKRTTATMEQSEAEEFLYPLYLRGWRVELIRTKDKVWFCQRTITARNSCLCIQSRRILTPFLTARFVLKDNATAREAVSAIHQVEEAEKVRFLFSWVDHIHSYRHFDSTTRLMRSFSKTNLTSSLMSDFKPIPQGNGHLDCVTIRPPTSLCGMFDLLFSLKEYWRKINSSSIKHCIRGSPQTSFFGIRSCYGSLMQKLDVTPRSPSKKAQNNRFIR